MNSMASLLAEINWWEIGLFAGLIVLAWGGSWLLTRFLRQRLVAARATGSGTIKIEVLKTIVPLFRWGILLGAVALGLALHNLPPEIDRWGGRLVQGVLTLLVAFVAGRVVTVLFHSWSLQAKEASECRSRTTLAPVLARTCQVFLYIIAVLLILQNIGYNVAGLLAGLGIGGLAVALAGKETLANLFGSMAVLIDQPFQIGDFIRIGETEGTVEKIGLRSTRVRTPDGFLVSIPNQNITTTEVVNLSARPTRRQVFTIGLVYSLSAGQMREALEIIRGIFAAHPKTADAWVYWTAFGDSSLNIQVIYWSKELVMKEFLAVLEELNLEIKAKLDAAGFGFAFPTRTVVLEREGD